MVELDFKSQNSSCMAFTRNINEASENDRKRITKIQRKQKETVSKTAQLFTYNTFVLLRFEKTILLEMLKKFQRKHKDIMKTYHEYVLIFG